MHTHAETQQINTMTYTDRMYSLSCIASHIENGTSAVDLCELVDLKRQCARVRINNNQASRYTLTVTARMAALVLSQL